MVDHAPLGGKRHAQGVSSNLFGRSLLLADDFGILCHLNSASDNVLGERGDFGELGSAAVKILVIRSHDCTGAFGTLVCQDTNSFQACNCLFRSTLLQLRGTVTSIRVSMGALWRGGYRHVAMSKTERKFMST